MGSIRLQMIKSILAIAVALLFSGCIFQKKICKATVEIPKDVIITQALLKQKQLEKSKTEVSTSSIEVPIAIIGAAVEYIKMQKNKKDKIIYTIIVYDNGTKKSDIIIKMPDLSLNYTVENFKKEKKNE